MNSAMLCLFTDALPTFGPAPMQVKAAGGVRTLERLLEVQALGVTRSGATATAAMLEEAKRRLGCRPIPHSRPSPKDRRITENSGSLSRCALQSEIPISEMIGSL